MANIRHIPEKEQGLHPFTVKIYFAFRYEYNKNVI